MKLTKINFITGFSRIPKSFGVTSRREGGFTLTELMVTVAVIGLITSVVVYNQGDFADKISLTNTASDIELQIREAQVYGVSVREFQPSSNEFNIAYGIVVNLNTFAGALGPTSFVSFVDRVVKDGSYLTPATWATCTVGGGSECLKIHPLSRNNLITDVCVIISNGTDVCRSGGATPRPGRIDISFLRPDPSARFIFRDINGNVVTFANHRGIKIKLTSPKGSQKSIIVYTTGQISVQ